VLGGSTTGHGVRAGNPGRTTRPSRSRSWIPSRHGAPLHARVLKRRDVLLPPWSARSDENERRAKRALFSIRNSRKLYDGLLRPAEPELMTQGGCRAGLRDQLVLRPAGKDGSPLPRDCVGREDDRAHLPAPAHAGRRPRVHSDSFGIARMLLRAGDERPNPTASACPSSPTRGATRSSSTSFPRAIYETWNLTLGDSLTELTEQLGRRPDGAGRPRRQSPRARRAELVRGTKVRDVAFRTASMRAARPRWPPPGSDDRAGTRRRRGVPLAPQDVRG